VSLPSLRQPFVVGTVVTAVGKVPRVAALLTGVDRWGSFKARWGVGRMRYTVDPGLYALGHPDDQSPVLVTANYKMSFDNLRRALPGRDAWILVLNTNGVNVWCAAGKGTFGTEELVARVGSCRLKRLVEHRRLILPQLAGPGVAAHQVKRLSGFTVVYGPIRADDLSEFFDAGLKATPAMRRQTFKLSERLVLIPVELVGTLKPAGLIAPALFLLGGLGGPQDYWSNLYHAGGHAVVALLTAILAGAVVMPLLLPWLPGRAFSVKGLVAGLLAALLFHWVNGSDLSAWSSRLDVTAWFVLIPTVAAFLAMNFTGASTYTSLSGVKKEMRWAVPLQISGTVLGLGLWLTSRFLA
jgi:hypothetical protein